MKNPDLFQNAFLKFDFTEVDKADTLTKDIIDIAAIMGYKDVTPYQAFNVWCWFSSAVFDEMWHVPISDKYVETVELCIIYFVRQFGEGNTLEKTRSLEPWQVN